VRPLFLDLGGDHRDTIFVAGTERSGTTWLADLINYRSRFRMIFEPFWALRVPESEPFSSNQYLRARDSSSQYLEAAGKILSGQVRNSWSDKYHRTFLSRRRLIKDVRTNLMLRWMYENFPGMPLVLILRHPCAVASSQSRADHQFLGLGAHFLGQPELVDDFLQPHLEAIQSPNSAFEEKILRWCIQNAVPLAQFEYGQIHVVFYEELCVDAHSVLERLFDYLDLPLNLDQIELSRQSPVSNKTSAILTGGSLVDQWREYVTFDEIEVAEKIFESFGLDVLYTGASMPNSENLPGLMRSELR
jgi:hypothetical protein